MGHALKSEGEIKEDEEQNQSQLKINEGVKKGDCEEGEAEDDEGILYVEQKYCTVCNLEQPLRTKHCRSCRRCVSTYDHHCPYLDNCVAEKNRHYFYWYLIFQQLQLAMGLYFVRAALSFIVFRFRNLLRT